MRMHDARFYHGVRDLIFANGGFPHGYHEPQNTVTEVTIKVFVKMTVSVLHNGHDVAVGAVPNSNNVVRYEGTPIEENLFSRVTLAICSELRIYVLMLLHSPTHRGEGWRGYN